MTKRTPFVLFTLFLGLMAMIAAPATAQEDATTNHHSWKKAKFRVTITNLTRAQVFSPPVVVSHNSSVALFAAGDAASDALVAMAEDGQTAPLVALAEGTAGVSGVAAASGPVLPGASLSVEVSGRVNHRITAVGMLVNTNDTFFGLSGAAAPWSRRAAYRYDVPAYDAGSEANNEECGFIPGPACGGAGAGVRAPEGAEGYVYISNGVHGIADLDEAAYDWRNPVARIVVERIR